MGWLGETARRAMMLFRRRQLDRDLEEEMQFHLEMRTRANAESGLSPEDAEWAARRQFGNRTRLAEMSRGVWCWRWLEALLLDVKFGARLLARNPGFTAVAVLTLALGIGANVAIFTVLYNVVLSPLGYRDPDRLVSVHLLADEKETGSREIVWSWPKFDDVRRDVTTFEGLAAYAEMEATLGGIHTPERLRLGMVTANYFPLLGLDAVRGRTFLPDEDARPGGPPVALVSHGLWRRVFGGDPSLVGRDIRIEGTALKVVGILPPGYRGESGEEDVWTPMGMAAVFRGPHAFTSRYAHWFRSLGRLKPGVTIRQASEDVRQAVARMERTHPGGARGGPVWSGGARALKDAKTNPVLAKSLGILLAATALVLLIACVNLANLLLGRAVARSREVAVRLALGAGRGTLVRQFAGESAVLAAAGSGAGLLLASWALRALDHIRPAETDREFGAAFTRAVDGAALQISAPVVGFAVLIFAVAALWFGLVPALQISRGGIHNALKSGSPLSAARPSRLRSVLAASQIALAVVLVAGAGLAIRSFASLLETEIGAETRHVLTMRVSVPRGADAGTFFRDLRERAAALPGVDQAAFADTVPLFGHMNVTLAELEGGRQERAGTHNVSQEYFSVFRVPLLRGRLLSAGDRSGAPRVAVINRAAARTFFPGEDAIGKKVPHPYVDKLKLEVVGVVGDVQYETPDQQVMPEIYMAAAQEDFYDFIAVRSGTPPASLIPALRSEVRALNPDAAVHEVRTMEERLETATSRQRFLAILLGAFSALALALAMVGVYGVFSYAVEARSREMGIRSALGASRLSIAGMVLREAAGVLAIGLIVGIPGAIAAGRLMRSLLYGVTPLDPGVYAGSVALLGALALLASYLPARRAAKADPLAVLKTD